jgi:hypothetical protein
MWLSSTLPSDLAGRQMGMQISSSHVALPSIDP